MTTRRELAMRVSVSVSNFTWSGGVATIAQRLGSLAEFLDTTVVDTLWVADHLLQADPASPVDDPMLEAYTTLGFLAAKTSRLRLGTMVTAVTFRAPVLLIKAVTTLDVLSGGRAWFGVGAGYNTDEARALGLYLPEANERFTRLAETLQLARRMWDDDQSAFHGTYVHADHPVARPAPMTSPRPPVLIGGTGLRRTLRLVAEYGDACNLYDIPGGDAAVRHQLDVLARHCRDVGRPYDDVERTITTTLLADESVDQLVQRCRTMAVNGLQHVVIITRGRPFSERDLTTVAHAAQQLANH